MAQEHFSSTDLQARARPSLRVLAGLVLIAFLAGGALVAWLVRDGRIPLLNAATNSPALTASPTASPTNAPAPNPAQIALVAGGFDQRVASLEQRLARIEVQAAASEGNTARAEALLVAFAARRSIERGAPLDGLENQLRLRFGEAQPRAVATVIAAAQRRETLDLLAAQLERLAPTLVEAPQDESGWTTFKRGISSLFVIRRADTPSPRPEDRMDRARMLLRSGQIDAAADEVGNLPGSPAAKAWIAAARRYGETQRALDLIETAALLGANATKS